MKFIVKFVFAFFFRIEKLMRMEDTLKWYRYYKIKNSLSSCGKGVSFDGPVIIKNPHKVNMGSFVSFSSYIHIWGGGGVKIGDHVLIGSHTAIVSETHDYTSSNMYTSQVKGEVVIEDDVWIGTHVVIFPNVTIGRGAVIGAGSIVNKDVLPGTIVAGAPIRFIKGRFD